ncbi:hypothetical protein appser6_22040 [Actinobacillus pleuropneumoniae serovar 6 str. Femo]|uniref:Uncharacterized protein n=1 Tax=Actinobacillus pleuropneumoniae serovar 6 str. Femo TaxID=754256 RepID=A0A828PW73_ACTPL|nr:hypothetical protein appser6_22040 [Actinobacillus pleuropneumoniae serovar 6 str. Femo]
MGKKKTACYGGQRRFTYGNSVVLKFQPFNLPLESALG